MMKLLFVASWTRFGSPEEVLNMTWNLQFNDIIYFPNHAPNKGRFIQ